MRQRPQYFNAALICLAFSPSDTRVCSTRRWKRRSHRNFVGVQDQWPTVLLLRRVYNDTIGHFGPIFWASTSIPAGFEEASAANNVTTVLQQDAQTQADVATLTPNATALPCQAPLFSTKCEACVGGCQSMALALNTSSLENEVTHYRVPGTQTDILLYRSHDEILFASVRPDLDSNWSLPQPTNITNDVANLNAGTLPSGKVYLVANSMINVFRDPLYLSTSQDGWAWDATHVIGSCEQSVFTGPSQPWGCLYRYPGGAKEGGLQYPQAIALTTSPMMYVVVSVNKEDIWVASFPTTTL